MTIRDDYTLRMQMVPRPPEPIDDLYDVVHTETTTVTQRAIDRAAADFTLLERSTSGLKRP